MGSTGSTGSAPPGAPLAPVSAHDLLGPVLAGEIERLRAAAARLLRGGAGDVDDEAIHDLRVALRRLRTALRPARVVYRKRRRLRRIEDALREHAQASGALRDEEVLRETIDGLHLPPGVREPATAWLAQRRADEPARRVALSARVSAAPDAAPVRRRDRKKPLSDTLTALAGVLAVPRRRAGDGATTAAQSLARAAADAIAAGGVDGTNSEALHDLRIRFKRLRYTAELFAPLFGELGERAGAHAATMQKRLGEVHDFDQATACAVAATELAADARAALLGALTAGRARAVRRALAELPKALAAATAVAPKDVTEAT